MASFVDRVPVNEMSVDEFFVNEGWTYVPLKKERKIERSISDYPGVLREWKRTYNVPRFDELSRREKMYILYSYGYKCIEFVNKDPMLIFKNVEEKVGRCKLYDALKCQIVNKRIQRRASKAHKKEKHEENQRAWFEEGGREAAYRQKYPFGNTEHQWFAKQLARSTGMKCVDTIVSANSWDTDEIPSFVKKPRWSRTSETSDTAQQRNYAGFRVRPLAPRSIMLLTKLRAIIRALRSTSYSKYNAPTLMVSVKPWKVVEPQMEGKDGETLNTVTSGNVVLTEENPGSSAVASTPQFRFDWHQLCSSERDSDYSYLLDRWTLAKTFDWTVNHAPNTEIKECKFDLPYDFIMLRTDGTMPISLPFRVHKYFRSDIEVKIHVNSNKFQVGQLQLSWQYMEKFDGNRLDNIYSRSQLPHVLVNAGACNEATLYIPYHFVQPYLHTSQRVNNIDCLYIGTLRLMVVAPLATGTGGPDSAGVSIFLRFPNSKFTGMRDGLVVDPQMEGAAAAMVAGAVYNKFIGDKNCDNPSINANPNYLVPTASHSWSAGTGLSEHIHSLRLDGSTKGVGRPGILNSETNIGIPCRTFGMLKHFNWKTTDSRNNASGTLLWSTDVHAQISKEDVYSVKSTNMTKYAFPPVSVVSSLYKHWRGSLEFKFDIIATQFHTGRLLCAYIPGFYGDASKITIWMARNSPHIEFSLQDATSFTFVVPFISNSPWWPRRYSGPHKYSEVASPSKLVIFVLNPLINMQDVVDKVVIVPYVRAGEDFEVSVPVQPAIGLSDNIVNNVSQNQKIYPTSGSYPMRATNYMGFMGGNYNVYYEGTAALGTASTFHAPERKLKDNEYYYGKFDNPDATGTIKWVNKAGAYITSKIGYIVLWGTSSGNYGVPYPLDAEGEENAKRLAKGLVQKLSTDQLKEFLIKYSEDGDSSSSDLSKLRATPQYNMIPKESEDFEILAEPQMDDRYSSMNLLAPTNPLPSTSAGQLTYNEKFNDLKDLCRRYQLYADKRITLNKGFDTGDTLCVFPVIPHGLELDVDSPDSVFNYCRDGHIPIVSSGYISFRGSIRYKLVFTSDSINLAGAKIWVQHHPDSDCRKHVMQVYPNIDEADSFKSHTYAFYIQNATVNSIIEFEVPFYQPGVYGLTRKPELGEMNQDLCQYYTLGSIVIGLYSGVLDRASDIGVKVYYSIGDDFSFNVFRGFPMMVSTDEVWPVSKKTEKRKIKWITAEPQMEESDVQPEMLGWLANKVYPEEKIKECKKQISKHIQDILVDAIEEPFSKLSEGVKGVGDKITDSAKLVIDKVGLTNALGNLLHVLANPHPRTIAVSIANIIVSLLTGAYLSLLKLVELLTEMFSKFWHLFDKNAATPENVTLADPQMIGEEEKYCNAFGAMIFSAVAAAFGVAIKGPGNYLSVLQGLNGSVMLCNNVVRFIENSGNLIRSCVQYITAKIYPDRALEAQLYNDIPELKMWYDECVFLCDVRNKSRYLYDKSMMSRVFDACVVGSVIVSSGLSRTTPGGKIIHDLYKDIVKIRNDLFERGAHPDVRFETFPLWISGRPGIGKSYLVTSLSNNLLKSINFTQPGSLIYYIPSAAKYWSGVQNPPVLVSDDLFQVNGTAIEEEIKNIFLICSSSVLNPPMAAVEDKERRLNPLLYIMLCNHHFPALSPMARECSAIYRRRKFLIDVDLKEEILEKYPNFVDASQLEPHERNNFAHLRFRFAINVKDPATEYTDWMDYETMFKIVSAKFRDHYIAERANFKQRMCDMYCLDPHFEEANIITDLPGLEDKISLKDKVEFIKDNIKAKIDEFSDPGREKTVWDFLRTQLDKIPTLPQMEEIGSEPGPSDAEPYWHLNWEDSLKSRTWDSESFQHVLKSAIPAAFSDDKLDNVRTILDVLDPEWEMIISYEHLQSNIPKLFEEYGINLNTKNSRFYNAHLLCLGKISNSDPATFINETNELFAKFLGYNPGEQINRHDWVGAILNQIICTQNVTSFEVLQTLVYLGMPSNLVLTYLYGMKEESYKKCNLDSQFKDFFLKLYRGRKAKIELLETLFQATATSDMKRFLDECLKEKDPLRAMLKEFDHEYRSFIDLQDQSLLWYISGLYHFIHNTVENQIIDEDVKIVLLAELTKGEIGDDFPTEIMTRLLQFVQDRIQNPLPKYSDVVTASLLKIAIDFYGWSLIVNSLLRPKHVCNQISRFRYFTQNLSKAKFCNVTGEVVLDRDCLLMCPYDKCVRGNWFVYSLYCVAAVSDVHWWMPTGSIFQHHPIEFTNVTSVLKKKRRPGFRPIVVRFFDNLKHHFFHTLPKMISKLISFIIDFLPIICSLALMVMGGAMIYKSLKPTNSFESVESQANYFKFDHPKVPKKTKIPHSSKAFVNPQMSADNRKVLCKKIERNTVLLYASWIDEAGEQHFRQCRNLMLRGRAMLTIRHFLEEYRFMIEKEKLDLKFFLFFNRGKDGPCRVSINWEDLQQVAWCSSDSERVTSNYGIIILPNFVPMFKDITKHFATTAEHNNVSSLVDLYVVNGVNSWDMKMTIKKNVIVGETSASSAVYMERVYSYNKQFKGLCGSILIGPTLGSGLGAIIGLHVAGSPSLGDGYSEPIYKEYFDSFFEIYPQTQVMLPEFDEDIKPDFELDSNLILYGNVPKSLAHKESGKSKIIPSLIAGSVYAVKTEINPLRPNDPRQPPGSHPLRDGCAKHGSGDVRVFDTNLVEEVKEHMKDRVPQIIRPIRAEIKPLTMQQAVCGDINVPYFEPLNWKSSEGFPLVNERPKSAHDKRWLFDLEEGEFGYKLNKLHPKLDLQMRIRQKCFEENVKPGTIYIDCLKDYRLSPEKCKQPGKTRIFSVAPIQCSLDIRTYCNDFCASLKNTRIVNSIGIGINPDSLEWTKLVNYLFEVGTKIITLDYSNFGPCLMSQLVAASNEVIVEWHKYHGASEEHVKRVQWLLDCDILNPVHLSSNIVYQTVNGISSGSPLTGECNSLPNLFYIRLTYLEIMREHCPELASMYMFDNLVRIVVYGDDLIMSVDDSIAETFNAITIRDYLGKHGITVTPARKNEAMVPYTSIYEASFLKRTFKEHPFRHGVWIAPIEQQSIEECINWCHISDDDEAATLEVCRASLDLAYSQGPEYYNLHYNKIKKALNNIGLTISAKTWYQKDKEIFGEGDEDCEPKFIKCETPWYYSLGQFHLSE